MVKIEDEGVFDAPVDKIWKYLNDPRANHDHTAIKAWKPEAPKGNTIVVNAVIANADGKGTHPEKYKMTMNPPTGFETEVIDGPSKGSKFTHTYTAKGKQTHVKVVGNWTITGLDDGKTKQAILAYLNQVFTEDNANLQKYK